MVVGTLQGVCVMQHGHTVGGGGMMQHRHGVTPLHLHRQLCGCAVLYTLCERAHAAWRHPCDTPRLQMGACCRDAYSTCYLYDVRQRVPPRRVSLQGASTGWLSAQTLLMDCGVGVRARVFY